MRNGCCEFSYLIITATLKIVADVYQTGIG